MGFLFYNDLWKINIGKSSSILWDQDHLTKSDEQSTCIAFQLIKMVNNKWNPEKKLDFGTKLRGAIQLIHLKIKLINMNYNYNLLLQLKTWDFKNRIC